MCGAITNLAISLMIADHSKPSHQPVFPVSNQEIAAPNQVVRDDLRYDFSFLTRRMNAHGPSPILSSPAASQVDGFTGAASTTGVPANEARWAPNLASSCWT